ncbi:MAG: hypothetical protein SFZ03_01560 [Candidatus Melainabacteria bacterium]|nr:hypothetical protein [Candidatus Melainabacteria bacterium]
MTSKQKASKRKASATNQPTRPAEATRRLLLWLSGGCAHRVLQSALTLAVGMSLVGVPAALAEDVILRPLSDGANGSSGYSGGYAPPPQQLSQNLPPLQGRVSTVPAGTPMMVTVQQQISSEYARPGDRITATLGNPLASGAGVVVPAGSMVEGQVVSAVKAGRGGRNGQLEVRFTTAMLPTGQRVPLSAKIQTEDGTGLIKGGTKLGRLGTSALYTGGGAAAGAVLGTALGPLSGGRVGRGAIYGTAVGAGLGALGALANKGEEAILPAGQPINLVLEQPLTLSGDAGAMNSGYTMPQQPTSGYDAQYNNPQYNNNGYNNPYSTPYNNNTNGNYNYNNNGGYNY